MHTVPAAVAYTLVVSTFAKFELMSQVMIETVPPEMKNPPPVVAWLKPTLQLTSVTMPLPILRPPPLTPWFEKTLQELRVTVPEVINSPPPPPSCPGVVLSYTLQ